MESLVNMTHWHLLLVSYPSSLSACSYYSLKVTAGYSLVDITSIRLGEYWRIFIWQIGGYPWWLSAKLSANPPRYQTLVTSTISSCKKLNAPRCCSVWQYRNVLLEGRCLEKHVLCMLHIGNCEKYEKRKNAAVAPQKWKNYIWNITNSPLYLLVLSSCIVNK